MTRPHTIDPRSTANATLEVREHTDLLVVGGGPAGLAAAIEAASHGLAVVLIDENPIPAATMGDDIPLHFGQRMGGAVRNRTAMTEAMLDSEPGLALAVEAGVDVRLGTVAWGLYANGPSVGWLPGKVAGLTDGEASWMLGFRSVIVAAGRRDMGLAFPGWERPGVMGATAAERLATRYGALDARRAVVLGSGAEALLAALAMRRAGVDVAAIVEQAPHPVGPAPLLEALAADGVEMLTRTVVTAATGDGGGVTEITVASLDDGGRRIAGSEGALACDTVVLGIGAVPVIELLDALGCRTVFDPARGGHVPVTDSAQMTSAAGVYAVGDCAGTWADKSMHHAVAEAEGRCAARHVAASGANTAAAAPVETPKPPTPVDAEAWSRYRLDWVRAAVVDAAPTPGETEAYVCQCEEVTAREIMEVRPPRYLNHARPWRNDTDLAALLGGGPPNADQVKRLTRAGMGLCQGRRCREQVSALLALTAGVGVGAVPLATYRAPVRPLSLGLAGSLGESAAMAEHWDVWFGIPGQATSWWELPPPAPAPAPASADEAP